MPILDVEVVAGSEPPAGLAAALADAAAAALTREVARVCGRPVENVHVLYEPDGAGRAASGGTVVE